MEANICIQQLCLYRMEVTAERKFSFGAWSSRQHAFFEIQAGKEAGYGENIFSVNQPGADFSPWLKELAVLKGRTVREAVEIVRQNRGVWPERLTEGAESALLDLAGKLTGRSALELLGLSGRRSVPGVYVILSDDLQVVHREGRIAAQGGYQFVKLKLFGDSGLDTAVIRAAREEIGGGPFLIGDVNCGYRRSRSEKSVAEIAAELKKLQAAGLSACEDPADMTGPQWQQLQALLPGLPLIPDEPMRPARTVAERFLPGMGGIYNIHPGCTGSIWDAVGLAGKIKESGARLMIGDDSLVGPGCAVWQQLAAGLEADWVEAVEKPQDSAPFLGCVLEKRAPGAPGFGLRLDRTALEKIAHRLPV